MTTEREWRNERLWGRDLDEIKPGDLVEVRGAYYMGGRYIADGYTGICTVIRPCKPYGTLTDILLVIGDQREKLAQIANDREYVRRYGPPDGHDFPGAAFLHVSRCRRPA